jgi:anti-sigma factor RsiW
MNRCARVRDLFGPYWDDETTRAEREWVDAHFAECPACRAEYETLARTLTAVGSLPRIEAAPDLAARSLAAARRSPAVRDIVFVRSAPGWVPVATAAALLLVAGVFATPWIMRSQQAGLLARSETPVAEPRLVVVATPAGRAAGQAAPAPAASGRTSVTISDSLFDHSEDVDFVLDPVTLRRGHAHTVSRLPQGSRGEQAVITF